MGDPVRCVTDVQVGQDAVLRLHQPATARSAFAELSLDCTLGEFVRLYYEPVYLVLRDARPRHLEEVRQSVKYWIRFTGDPPLGAITAYHARDFVVGLKGLAGRTTPTLSTNTVRKHCAAIQAILDLCGPSDRRNREGLGLYDAPARVPFIPRPRQEEKPAEDCFTFAELVALLEHADAAVLPTHLACSPGEYQRRLMSAIFNGGMRIGGLMGVTWKFFHGDHLVLKARHVAKGFRSLRIECNEPLRAVIESMRGCDAERIFPWPQAWPGSRQQLHAQFRRVTACLPPARRFGYHGLRKLHNNELAKINGLACMKSLGHTSGRTTVEHYTSRALVAEAVAKLPALPRVGERQRLLF